MSSAIATHSSVIPALCGDPLIRRKGRAENGAVRAAAPWIPALATLGRDDDCICGERAQ